MDTIQSFLKREIFGSLGDTAYFDISKLRLTDDEITSIASLLTTNIINEDLIESNGNYLLFAGLMSEYVSEHEDTKKYLLLSIEKGNIVASYMLAKYYNAQLRDWEWGHEGYHNRPDEKYHKYLLMANKHDPNNADILFDLGEFYGTNLYYCKNTNLQLQYFNQACKLGHIKSMKSLENYYRKHKDDVMMKMYGDMIKFTKSTELRVHKYNKLISCIVGNIEHKCTFYDPLPTMFIDLLRFCIFHNFDISELPDKILTEFKTKYYTVLYNKEIVELIHKNIEMFRRVLDNYDKHVEIIDTIVRYTL